MIPVAVSRRWPVTWVILALAACTPARASPSVVPEANLHASAPQVTATAPGQARTYGSLALAASRFVHPTGSFALFPPEGWPVDVDGAGATWTDPGGEGRIGVRVNRTGYQLDGEHLDNFIQAVEQEYAETFEGYVVRERSIDSGGAKVVRQSTVEDGSLYQLVSVYEQEKDVIYESRFWAKGSAADGYMPAFEEIWRQMEVDTDNAASSIEFYADVHRFQDPGGLFSLDVPWGWYHEVYTQSEAVADTFWAPDRKARVEVIKYDDGTVISKSLAGAFALDLLHQRYAEGARIKDDKVQSDGRERLTWISKDGNLAGVSLFETMGTTFLMLTFMGDTSAESIYPHVFDRLLPTFSVP